MQAQDKLFQLIAALSKSEKRYFSVHMAQSSRQQHLLEVFNAIRKQETYDESALLEQFKGERFVKQFHVTKNRLFHAILKSMRQYHSERSILAKVRGRLGDVRFLYERQLYDECQRLLAKAKQQVLDYQEDLLLLEILYWEDKLLVRSRYIGRSVEDIWKIDAEVEQAGQRYLNLRHFRSLESQLFYYYYQHLAQPKLEEPLSAIEKLMESPLLQAPENALSFKARCYFYNIQAQYHGLKKNWERTYKVRRDLVRFIQQKGPKTPEGLRNHTIALHNLILVAIRTHHYEAALQGMQAMRSLPDLYKKLKISDTLKQRIFPKSYVTELGLCSLRGDLERGKALAERLEEEMAQIAYELPKNFLFHLYFTLAEYYFTISDYPTTLEWAERLLNDEQAQAVPLWFLQCQALVLLCHWEMGNTGLQDYLQRALQHQLKKHKHYDDYWSAFFSGMRKVQRVANRKAEQATFAQTAQLLEQILDAKKEIDLPRELDLPNWCWAKAKKVDFLALKRQRAKLLEQD